MYNLKAKLVLDQGNSQERVAVIFNANGVQQKEIFELSNVFSNCSSNYVVPEMYNADTSVVFSVDLKTFANTTLDNSMPSEGGSLSTSLGDSLVEHTISGTYVHGNLCKREFSTTAFRPSATIKKYLNLNTPLAFIMAMFRGTQKIASILGVQDLNDLSIEWDVYTLLPPNDIDKGEDIIEKTFRSIKQVHFTMPEYTMNVNIGLLKVYPEGFCAFMGAVFDENYKIREGYENLIRGKVLVIDIGAGTTDLLLIDNATVVSRSRDSLVVGGNQVTQGIKRYLRKHDIELSDEAIQNSVVTGTIQDGARVLNITQIVQAFKEETAQEQLQKLKDYFETSGILPRSVSDMLICGGGSLGGDTDELTPLSKMLYGYLKGLAPNSKIVELPKDANGKPISPRYLNLIGAMVLALMK